MHNACTPHALIFAIVALSACAQISAPVAPEFSILPDANGLAVAPSGLRIDFGRSPEGVIALLDENYGAHTALSISTCPTGTKQNLRWNDLVLAFTEEQFVGWQLPGTSEGQICMR